MMLPVKWPGVRSWTSSSDDGGGLGGGGPVLDAVDDEDEDEGWDDSFTNLTGLKMSSILWGMIGSSGFISIGIDGYIPCRVWVICLLATAEIIL